MEGEQAQRSRVLPVSPENRTPGYRLLTAESQVPTGQLQITPDSFPGHCTGCC